MKVLFVFSLENIRPLERPLKSWDSVQMGISFISSVLKEHGHQTSLVILGSNHHEASLQKLKSSIQTFSPGLICFSAVFSQYSFIEAMARFTKKEFPHVFQIVGGVHPTLNPREVIDGPFDALCVGEGEYPTLELCSQLGHGRGRPEKIPNLWIKSSEGAIEINPPREFIQNLDKFPHPDREMWEPSIDAQSGGRMSVLLGRGCPYECTYCSNHSLKKASPGKYVRMRSPENIVKELSLLHQKYASREIHFEVEAIALDKAWAFKFFRQLELFNQTIKNHLVYTCNFRISPDSVDENLFKAFKRANVHKISIGLESGSERVRREILNRNYSNSDFLATVNLARIHGLKISIFNMIGLPDETLNEHLETVSLNRKCQPEGHFTSIFFPYPGTKIHDYCLRKGLLKKPLSQPQMERSQSIISSPHFSKSQIQHAYVWFNYQVYKGHKPLRGLLYQTLFVKINSNKVYHQFFRRLFEFPILNIFLRKFSNLFKG